jgi:quinoprotein glucose dehydrogenase
LRALADIGVEPLDPIVRVALSDEDPDVRMAALELIPEVGLPPAVTSELLTSVVGRGSIEEQQAAVTSLGALRTPEATTALGILVDRLAAEQLPAEVELELFEAIDSIGSAPLAGRAEQIRTSRIASGSSASFSEALHGGSRNRGQQIALRNESAQCARCHAFAEDGPEIAPDLRGVGARLSRAQLLEALVDPSARLAPGYGSTQVTLQGGEVVAGTILDQSGESLVLRTATEPRRVIPLSTITARSNTPSAMPPMGEVLSRRQLRDLVEYLTTLR